RLAVLHARGAEPGGDLDGVRIEHGVFGEVVEHHPAVVVHVGFGGGAFGEDHVMAVQLDMEVVHALDGVHLDDGDAVHEGACGDQHVVDVHGVQGRDVEVPPGAVFAEGAGLDEDGQDVPVAAD